jgi:hypothetical protein
LAPSFLPSLSLSFFPPLIARVVRTNKARMCLCRIYSKHVQSKLPCRGLLAFSLSRLVVGTWHVNGTQLHWEARSVSVL